MRAVIEEWGWLIAWWLCEFGHCGWLSNKNYGLLSKGYLENNMQISKNGEVKIHFLLLVRLHHTSRSCIFSLLLAGLQIFTKFILSLLNFDEKLIILLDFNHLFIVLQAALPTERTILIGLSWLSLKHLEAAPAVAIIWKFLAFSPSLFWLHYHNWFLIGLQLNFL